MNQLSAILALGAFAVFFFFLIALAFYVLNALALFTLAKNNGYESLSILAWIPFANMYLFGVLSGDDDGNVGLFKQISVPANLVGILLAVLPFITAIPILGFIAWIAFLILYAHTMYYLLSKIDASSALVITIVSFFIPLVLIVYLFIKRDSMFDGSYVV